MHSLIKKREEMRREPLPNCHDGDGSLDWTTVLDGSDIQGRRLQFIHDNILAPGTSIGVHRHEHDEEYYYILSGEGTMTLDDQQFPVTAGDITAVFPGGSHGLENTSQLDLRILVIGLAP